MMSKLNHALTICILSISTLAFGQEKGQVSLTYKAGYGFASLYDKISGSGPAINLGLSHQTPWEWLSINSDFEFGSYKSGEDSNQRDEYFNFMGLDLQANLRLVNFWGFSLNVQAGGYIGNARGLNGTGSETDNSTYITTEFTSSEFINEFAYGIKAGGSMNYTPKKGRLSFAIYPANVSIGKNYASIISKVGIAVALNKRE